MILRQILPALHVDPDVNGETFCLVSVGRAELIARESPVDELDRDLQVLVTGGQRPVGITFPTLVLPLGAGGDGGVDIGVELVLDVRVGRKLNRRRPVVTGILFCSHVGEQDA